MTKPHRIDMHVDPINREASLISDVQQGLSHRPRSLPPKWFYDAAGSELFEAITQLPEYYPTRTERALLRECASEIAALTHAETLVELGSGSSEKTQLLIDALLAAGNLTTYVAQDVSESALLGAMNDIADRYPTLDLHGVVSDFSAGEFRDGLRSLPHYPDSLLAFLGGTIGNLVPEERAHFFAAVRQKLKPGEHLLIGVGLIAEESAMIAAYDDAAGVTARFNKNVLNVLNRELGADFPVDKFRHVAVWDRANSWIEMRLRAVETMTVQVKRAELSLQLAEGEEIRTEISAKFDLAAFLAELEDAGFSRVTDWRDPVDRFALILVNALPASI
ncbi:L-histidine N(alpha)-methyltransferase [Hoyosella altamirensis]|uniref:L-histidine N-alpha-methyltransferase n=1 Tax=Hoyosella altamirensis TaxID=616997 RepID=A0A839RM03_9ACTN|nr:L-histidine N(alpha)-methyltransferase [Hoyosella altamirensis]MBB3037184.1 L-histidine N-alpha-methyltransferase [Hoyosella altamirensis]